MYIQIVTKSGHSGRLCLFWLARVDFPRVKVKNTWNSQISPSGTQRHSREFIWQQAKIAPAGCLKISAQHPDCRKRDFEKACLWTKWRARGPRGAIQIMRNRVDARAILKTLLSQNAVGPRSAGADRKGG